MNDLRLCVDYIVEKAFSIDSNIGCMWESSHLERHIEVIRGPRGCTKIRPEIRCVPGCTVDPEVYHLSRHRVKPRETKSTLLISSILHLYRSHARRAGGQLLAQGACVTSLLRIPVMAGDGREEVMSRWCWNFLQARVLRAHGGAGGSAEGRCTGPNYTCWPALHAACLRNESALALSSS